jgi:hypothetical protein
MSEETNSGIRGDALATREHLKADDVAVQLDHTRAGHLAPTVLDHGKVPKSYASSPNPDYIADDVENAGVPDESLEHL